MDSLALTNSFTNDHTKAHKITLALKTHTKRITLDHTIGSFLTQARTINEVQRTAFSYKQFPQLSHDNFRRIIHNLGDKVERYGKGRPQFYKLTGIKLPGDSHRITLGGTGVQNDYIKLLESLKDQPPKIHDIKIKVINSEVHEMLVQKGCSVDSRNHSIKVNYESIDNNITTKILVYPNTIQIDIGCTYNPLVYNTQTFWFLHEHLAKISYHLTGICGAILPPVNEWIITHYHYGKDGTQSYNGQTFQRTIEDVGNGLIRFYSKLMKDGKTIVRLEQAQSPQCSIEEKMEELIES